MLNFSEYLFLHEDKGQLCIEEGVGSMYMCACMCDCLLSIAYMSKVYVLNPFFQLGEVMLGISGEGGQRLLACASGFKAFLLSCHTDLSYSVLSPRASVSILATPTYCDLHVLQRCFHPASDLPLSYYHHRFNTDFSARGREN